MRTVFSSAAIDLANEMDAEKIFADALAEFESMPSLEYEFERTAANENVDWADAPLAFAVVKLATALDVKNMSLSWIEFVARIKVDGHRVGDKDGPALLSCSAVVEKGVRGATLKENKSARNSKNMRESGIAIFEGETGQTLDEALECVEKAGITCVGWHTASSGKAQSVVAESDLLSFANKSEKWRGSQGVLLSDGPERDEFIGDYFHLKKSYQRQFTDSMHRVTRVENVEAHGVKKSGVGYIVQHEPMERWRIVIPRAVSFVLVGDGVFQDAQIVEYKDRYLGFAHALGLEADTTGQNVDRLMYLPSRPKSSEHDNYRIVVVEGRPTTLEDMPRLSDLKQKGDNDERAFSQASREVGVRNKKSGKAQDRFKTPRFAEFLARDKEQTFRVLDWMRDKCPEWIVNDGDGDKEQIQSPVSDQHNDGAGFNPASPGAFAQQGDEGWNMFDSHASGKAAFTGENGKHDKALMLDAMLQSLGVVDAVEELGAYVELAPPRVYDLPPGFTRRDGSIYLQGSDDDDDEGDAAGTLICSDFKCAARARDAESGAWSRILEFENGEGIEKTIAVADAELQGEGVSVRERLAADGLFISTNPKARREFLRLMNTIKSESKVRHSTKTGFMGANNEVFLLPVEVEGVGGAVFAPEADDEFRAEKHVWTKRPPKFTPHSRGALKGWQEAVKIAFKQNGANEIAAPHVAEGILRGASGPLISLADRDPMGVHYVGASSSGKTTAGQAQVSVWCDPVEGRGLMVAAKATANGMETVFEMFNDTTGVVNDLENGEGSLTRELPYMAANRQGKRRMNKNADVRAVASWCGFAYSQNSERTPQQLMGKFGVETAGMYARTPVLNTSNVPKMEKATIDVMVGAFKDNFGHAGPDVVAGVYKRGWHLDCSELKALVSKYHKEYSGDLDPAQRRALEVFSFARVAGDLMVEDGILGSDITKDDVATVIQWVVDQAKAAKEFHKLKSSENGARQLIEWLNTSGQVYDVGLKDYEGRPTPLAFKDDVKGVAYMIENSFGKIDGITASASDIIEELKRKDLLEKNGDKWWHKYIPGIGSVKHCRIKLEATNTVYGDGEYMAKSEEEKAFEVARRGCVNAARDRQGH